MNTVERDDCRAMNGNFASRCGWRFVGVRAVVGHSTLDYALMPFVVL